jgi:hypothetical protein
MNNNIPTVYISEIHCCIVKCTNLSTILPFCTKNIKKLKNIVFLRQHLNASLLSVLAISEYFMFIQCLKNIGEGLLPSSSPDPSSGGRGRYF